MFRLSEVYLKKLNVLWVLNVIKFIYIYKKEQAFNLVYYYFNYYECQFSRHYYTYLVVILIIEAFDHSQFFPYY